ncbi:MAG: response regulator [Desulfatiglandaceae bacterium]
MKPLCILVVDDEPSIYEACHLILTEQGHTVECCKTGENGLQAISKGRHDLILLDIKLPDMDGMEILKSVRDRSASAIVIVMTGYSTLSNALEAMKRGATDYLCKPFTDDDLIQAVENAVSEKRRPAGQKG